MGQQKFDFKDPANQAILEKSWDGFLAGNWSEPLVWYPSQGKINVNYTYDVDLAWNISYFDFNASALDSQVDNSTTKGNMADVYFMGNDTSNPE